MKRQLLWLSLFAVPFCALAADGKGLNGEGYTCLVVTGGGGSTWTVCDSFITTNALPSGGSCDSDVAGAGASMSDATIVTGAITSSDAFDEGVNVWVNNAIVGGLVTATANRATFAPTTRSGLTVNMRYDFLTTESTERTFVTFTNPSQSAISATITYTTNFGSDGNTVINATSSGDTVFTAADRWLITSDGGESDPVNTTVLWSGTPRVVPNSATTTVYDCANTPGALTTYPITVPAGGTVSLVFFQRLTETVAQATATAAQFNDLQPGSPLLAGLTPTEISQAFNIAGGPPPPPPIAVPMSPQGLGILAGLLALLGLIVVRRRA